MKKCKSCFYAKVCMFEDHQSQNGCKEYLNNKKVIITPYSVGDTVYYITGIHGRLAKPARVEEIYYNGSDFSLRLVSENNVYFDLPADKVYATEENCLKHINKEN